MLFANINQIAPFRGPGVADSKWWGGYCNHGNVLFPTWHRAYLLRLENALRSIDGCGDVTLPYWDELFDESDNSVPKIFTDREFEGKPNPLYSYSLQEALVYNFAEKNNRYTKPVGYTTVRYPLSGLVGTEEARVTTEAHNEAFSDETANVELNKNVAAWLKGTVIIPDDDVGTRIPDTYSISSRYRICLAARNYTVFSNTTSQNQWIKDFSPNNQNYAVSLESPHNAMHLAVGGFYQRGIYNANPIRGANGDMGDNETASFDPIFFFHHCFVDYAFWVWQLLHGKTNRGSLEGTPFLPPGTKLTMDTPLYPFRKPDEMYYSSHDLTNILEIPEFSYQYETGSLEILPNVTHDDMSKIEHSIVHMKRVHNISRAKYSGSFVIRTFAGTNEQDKIEIGHEPVLSRRNIDGCANCQNNLNAESLVPIYKDMLETMFKVEIDSYDHPYKTSPSEELDPNKVLPIMDDLY
ncbi:putative tyrosinase [Trichoderma ceciliae]